MLAFFFSKSFITLWLNVIVMYERHGVGLACGNLSHWRILCKAVQSQLTLWLGFVLSLLSKSCSLWPICCYTCSNPTLHERFWQLQKQTLEILSGFSVFWAKLWLQVSLKYSCHISLTSRGHTTAAKSGDWTPWICCCLVNLITRMN